MRRIDTSPPSPRNQIKIVFKKKLSISLLTNCPFQKVVLYLEEWAPYFVLHYLFNFSF